jgi:predicted ATPase
VCAAAPEELFVISGNLQEQELTTTERFLQDDFKVSQDKLSMFLGEEERFAFARAVSRLKEMQTVEYLQSQHRDAS